MTEVAPRFATAAVATALFAACALVGRPAGLGLALALLALVASGAAITPRDRWTTAWWALAGVLALMPFLRTAGWVVALSVLGAVGLAVTAAGRAFTWGRLFEGPARWVVATIPGPVVVGAAAGRGASGPARRGLAAAALLVLVFGGLLTAADAAFADLAGRVVPALDGDDLPWRLVIAWAVAAVFGALALVAALPAAEPVPAGPPLAGRTETRIALGALVLLFAAFVAVQAATLFGGDAFVRRTAGLTYAEYARQGFWILLVVAALVLGVIAAAVRYGRADGWLLAALGLLTLVVLVSAWHRLDLYVDAYGATRARTFAAWSIVWLAGLFGLRRPRTVVTWSAVLGVAFGLSNPDARIAAHTRDPAYRATLSDDAAPGCADRSGGVLSLTLC